MKINKKGVSPVISTVLLIMIVIISASLILMWSRGFIKEKITKDVGTGEKDAEQVCRDISMKSILNNIDGSFGFTNNGNVPIYAINLKLAGTSGSSQRIRVGYEDGGSANPGQSILIEDYPYDNYDEVKIIPIILGNAQSSGGVKEFECPEEYALVI